MAGALLAAVTVVPPAADAPLPLVGPTDASWADVEHVHAPLVGLARDCTRPWRYASTASSRVLAGTLLGSSLDRAVQLSGVSTTHSGAEGTTSTAQPASAPAAGEDTHAAPLDVRTLGGVAGVGVTAPAVVVLPSSDQQVALLQQRSRATSHGAASSATGALADDGTVRTTPVAADGTGEPRSAVVHLGALAPQVSALADLRLEVGALASSASLDGCERDEHGAGPVRTYHVGDLDLVLSTSTLGPVQAVPSAVAAELAGAAGAVTQAVAGLAGLTSPLVQVDVQLTGADGAALASLSSARLGTGGAVEVDLATGTVVVDLAGLLAADGGLDGRAPGTELVLDDVLLARVGDEVGALLRAHAAAVRTLVEDAVGRATVDVRATALGALGVRVDVLRLSGTVGGLLAGQADVPVLGLGLVGRRSVVVSTVAGALRPLVGPPGAAGRAASAVGAAVPDVVTSTTAALGGLRSAVSLVVNDQRQTTGPTGRTATADVAALRVRVLPGPPTTGTAGTSDLRLSTSSVGPVLERP